MSDATSAWPAAAGTLVERLPEALDAGGAWAVECRDGPDAYGALQRDWLALMARMERPCIFQAPDFLTLWAEVFAAGAARRLRTIVVRRAGRPVLIWPLALERRGPVIMARGAGAPVAQYDDVATDSDFAEAALDAAWAALAEGSGADLVRCDRVRADSPLAAFLARRGAPVGPTDVAPYADLPAAGFDAFMAEVKPRVQRHQRRRARQLSELGDVRFAVADAPATAVAWLHEAIALKRRWLVETGRLSAAFVERRTTQCLVAVAQRLSAPGGRLRMLVARLEVGGQTAALSAGLAGGGTYHLYLGAFHPDFARFGAGNILTERTIAWCCDNGLRRYDMLAPQARSKSDWQTGETDVYDFAVPLTARGRIYADCVERRFKPALRAAFYALPLPLRATAAAGVLKL